MRKSLRILGWTTGTLFAIPVLLYLGLVLVNLKDDPLSPEVEKLLTTSPPAIEASTNAYFAWIGIAGPEDQEPHSWGQRWYNEALSNDKQARVVFPPPLFALDKEKRNESQKLAEIPCHKLETCLDVVLANPEAARNALQMGKITLDRGDKALTYPAYQEPWRPDYSASSALPPFNPAWSMLNATRFALAVSEGRHEEALEQLKKEIGFQNRQIQGSSSLIDKLVGFGYLRHRYLLLSQYLQRYPTEAQKHVEHIAGMLTSLPSDAVSLQSCMQSEKRFTAIVLLSLKDQKRDLSLLNVSSEDDSMINSLLLKLSDLLAPSLFLENLTVNDIATQYDVWIRVDSLKEDAYRQAIADARNGLAKQQEQTFSFRNPVGNILKNVSGPDFSQYFLRRDDLLALRALVELQFKLLRQGAIDSEAIEAKIKANQESLRHPYSGALPFWDKHKRSLSYPLVMPEGKNKLLAILI